MKQRVVTVFSDFKNTGVSNLDTVTKQLETNNYVIKQIVSTSIENISQPESHKFSRLAITLLLEKVD
jgi:hypothetical protein